MNNRFGPVSLSNRFRISGHTPPRCQRRNSPYTASYEPYATDRSLHRPTDYFATLPRPPGNLLAPGSGQ